VRRAIGRADPVSDKHYCTGPTTAAKSDSRDDGNRAAGEPDALAGFGAGVEDVRRRLHGVTADDRLYVGADCAIEIWRRTLGDVWLGRVPGLPVLRQITRVAYGRFADILYAWNRRNGRWRMPR
jgi:predicted DCC family thiol-disulfide oxidoreductase YuxK